MASAAIHPDLWFWLKFIIGLGIVAITIYMPLGLIGATVHALPYDREAAATIPALHLATFAAAIAMTCLVRHAVYAAILTIAVLYLSVVVVWLAWIVLGLFAWIPLPENWLDLLKETQVIVSGLITCFAVSTIAAWFMVRYDWGLKSRY